jgi:hypothetical protein
MKRNALFLVMIFFATSLFAEKVEVDKATKVAQSHVYGNVQLRSAQDEGIKLVYTATGDPSLRSSGNQGETVYYYVFNVKENDGFVIVSGDDIAIPVLGYSKNGTYDAQHLPPAFSYWMECLQKEIGYGIQQHLPQNAETKQKWDAYLQGTAPALHYAAGDAPLIETKWNQGAPFNNSCPVIGGQTLTGCVATAMAQIMKYYEWPEQRGTGTLPGYTTSTAKYSIAGIDLAAEPAYNWGNMLLNYSGNPTEAQKQAVATLMYHCGVSVEMDYGVEGSGAISNYIGKVLPIHFGYDKGIQGKSRSSYTDDQWHTMLKTEIDDSRPVIYSGDGTGGHAFICDGYKSDNTFHFNWGWGGSLDGYFATNALKPSGNNFSYNQSIIINIKPDAEGAKVYEMAITNGHNFISTATTPVDRGAKFTIGVPMENAGVADFSGNIYLVLVDGSENPVCDLGHFDLELPVGYFYSSPNKYANCVVPPTVDAGTYNIRAYAQANDETTRTLVKIPVGTEDVSITVNDYTLPDNSELALYDPKNLGKAFAITPAEPKAGEAISVSFSVVNIGNGEFYGTLKLGLYKNDMLVQVIEEKELLQLSSLTYFNQTFSNASLPEAGNYKLRLYAQAVTGVEKLVENNGDAKNDVDITITGPPVTTYSISIATFNGGGLDVDKDQAEAEETVTVTATPDPGHELSSLSYYINNPSETTSIPGAGNTRTFTMPASNITLTATFQETADQQAVKTAQSLIEGGTYTVLQTEANDETAVKTWLANAINGLPGMNETGLTINAGTITISGFVAAVAGTADTPDGSDGNFTFTVSLQKGNSTTITSDLRVGTITAVGFTVAAEPVISSQPATSTTVTLNTPVTLSVTASAPDNGTLSYQWYENTENNAVSGTSIPDAINEDYSPSTSTIGTTYYYVIISNTIQNEGGPSTATATSFIAEVTVNALVNAETPSVSGPEDVTANEGGNVSLLVDATVDDNGHLTYQWFSNDEDKNSGGTLINEATKSKYSFSATTAGIVYYYVEVTNTNDAATGVKTAKATSKAAKVTINALVNAETPVITGHPTGDNVDIDDNITLTVTTEAVNDGGILTYQWFSNITNTNSNGTLIDGATSYKYLPPTATVGTMYYYVEVTNTNEAATGAKTAKATSNTAAVTVVNPSLINAEVPTISTQLQNYSVSIGDNVKLTVAAKVNDNGKLSYQWYTGGGAINGATTDTYEPSTATAGSTQYYVIVTNTNNEVSGTKTATATSNTATVTVTDPNPGPGPDPDPEPPTVFAITIATMTNGTVSANPASSAAGETVTLTITPAQGYELSSITVRQIGASTTLPLGGTGNTRTFTMQAYDVTIEAAFTKTQQQEEIEALGKVGTAIEGGTFLVAQMVANTDEPLSTWLVNTLNALFGQSQGIQFRSATPMDAEVTLTSVTPAIAGTEENPKGTNGSFIFTVTLNNGNSHITTGQVSGVIIAKPHASIEVKNVGMFSLGGSAVRITNTGNVETGKLAFTLSGTDAGLFSLTPATLNNLETGGEAEIMITPKEAFTNHAYTFTLTATAEGMEPVSINITYNTSVTATEETRTQTLYATATASGLYISGLIPGETFSVYNLRGQLFYKGKATASEQYVNLRDRGVYIITNGNKTVKAIY